MSLWNKKIFSSEDNIFALDLSDLSAKIFQLEKDGKVDRIRSYCDMDVPYGYIEDGRILEKEKVAEIIKKAASTAVPKKIKTKKVACSVSESKAFLRIINIPKMKEEEAMEAIKWEIEASIPMSVDQVYFDWQFLNESDGKQNVLTVAVSREIVDDLTETLSLAGLNVCRLELESIACCRSLIPSDSLQDDVFLIADIGSRKTSFIISEGSIPYFTSSIPFSSEVMSDYISKSLNVNAQEAEKIKIVQGIEHSLDENSIFNIIKPLLENLANEIERSIDFYQNISKTGKEVRKVILCGGGANLRGIIPYLTTKLNKEVVAGDPWINLNLGSNLPIINKESSVRYSTAVGLALKKNNYGNQH